MEGSPKTLANSTQENPNGTLVALKEILPLLQLLQGRVTLRTMRVLCSYYMWQCGGCCHSTSGYIFFKGGLHDVFWQFYFVL